jgi:hypothetical protein
MTLRYAPPPLASALVLLIACGERAPSGPKVSLRYHPPAGAVYRYTLEQRNAMTMESGPMAGMGKQELVMTMHFTQSVTGPVAGGTEVRVTFDSINMLAPGVPPDMMERELGRLRGLQATVLFDERAQVVRTDFRGAAGVPPEMTAQMASGIKAMSFAFPADPVGPGDTWTVETELPMGALPGASRGAGAARTTLTVKSVDVENGDTTVVFDVNTTFPEDPIPLDLGGQRASLRLTGSLAGDQQFSITRGAVLRSAVKGTAKVSLTAGAAGTPPMEMTTDAETTLRLQGGP